MRRVRSSGEIKWGGRSIFISETLGGEPVGIAETSDGQWLVRYAHIDLGIIHPRRHRLTRFVTKRPTRIEPHEQRTLSPI